MVSRSDQIYMKRLQQPISELRRKADRARRHKQKILTEEDFDLFAAETKEMVDFFRRSGWLDY